MKHWRRRLAPVAPSEARVPEKTVQRDVVNLYEGIGCTVYTLSQPRATMQSEGIPDLYVFAPRRKGSAWWHETKAADGKMSEDQLVFMGLCAQRGVGHVVGGVDAARAKLVAEGLIARV